MTCHKARDIRYPVQISARVRTGFGLIDANVCNVSSRGLLLLVKRALKPGSFVEILRPGNSFTGRVVWAIGKYAGIQLREPIDVVQVIRTGRLPDHAQLFQRETDTQFRKSAVSADSSQLTGRWLQFVFITIAIAGVAWLAVDVVNQFFHAPIAQARQALPSASVQED